MMVALELATANNYSISTWLTRNNLENHVSPCVIITLQRLVKHINPSIDTTDDLESLLQLLLRIKLYQYVSKGRDVRANLDSLQPCHWILRM